MFSKKKCSPLGEIVAALLLGPYKALLMQSQPEVSIFTDKIWGLYLQDVYTIKLFLISNIWTSPGSHSWIIFYRKQYTSFLKWIIVFNAYAGTFLSSDQHTFASLPPFCMISKEKLNFLKKGHVSSIIYRNTHSPSYIHFHKSSSNREEIRLSSIKPSLSLIRLEEVTCLHSLPFHNEFYYITNSLRKNIIRRNLRLLHIHQ